MTGEEPERGADERDDEHPRDDVDDRREPGARVVVRRSQGSSPAIDMERDAGRVDCEERTAESPNDRSQQLELTECEWQEGSKEGSKARRDHQSDTENPFVFGEGGAATEYADQTAEAREGDRDFGKRVQNVLSRDQAWTSSMSEFPAWGFERDRMTRSFG